MGSPHITRGVDRESGADRPRIVILGAGPAGLGAAYGLARKGLAQVTVIERGGAVGGNAGSFEVAGLHVDYGSHRLHPACDPEILAEIRSLLGDDLLDRPRHGRIRLRNRWIHFPLKPLDLAFRTPPSFALGVVRDMAAKAVGAHRKAAPTGNFAEVLEAGLGRTICRDFYFPYAVKLWGIPPEQLSGTQARRRVQAGSLGKMLRKVMALLPGVRRPGGGRFFYPRRGYGQISSAYHRAAVAAGADVRLNSTVRSIDVTDGRVRCVYYERQGERVSLPADQVWSTIPLTVLARSLNPAPPDDVLGAAMNIDYRGMILIYVVLEQDQFSEYDAHYFPGSDIPISRMSEPKNYSVSEDPKGLTVLCAELPCRPGDPEWDLSDEELGQLVRRSLETAGIPVRARVRQVLTRRLREAYPIYRQGYEVHFGALDRWVGDVGGLLTFGRQGLFAHDNTHHALFMAHSAVACLDREGRFDQDRWQGFRRVFETHVVED